MKISVNKDIELVEAIRGALIQKYGYCPCKLDHIPENLCMCKAFRTQTEPGECHCGLYIKEEA